MSKADGMSVRKRSRTEGRPQPPADGSICSRLLGCALLFVWPAYGAETSPMPPEQTSARVMQRLAADPIQSLSCVNVTVHGQTAILTGTVTSLIASERAEQVARGVDGVSQVLNSIDVQPTLLLSPAEFRAAIASLVGTDSSSRSGEKKK